MPMLFSFNYAINKMNINLFLNKNLDLKQTENKAMFSLLFTRILLGVINLINEN